MDLLSLSFLCFLAVLTVIYFLVPKRMQWQVLLAGSLFFYICSGIRDLLFVLITASSTYLAANRIDRIAAEQKAFISAHRKDMDRAQRNAAKERFQKKRRLLLVLTLVLNFGLLCVFKYLHFVVAQINALLAGFGSSAAIDNAWKLIVPLGISFYTFQTMGYLVDVYWKKVPAEKNFAKTLLFVSFFPQMTQGPISDFSELSQELFTEHSFTYHHFSWGVQRMFWGFFKKMALANVLSIYVNDVFANYGKYTGLTTLLGAFFYSMQIYADFSGYMDIVCGYCEILGIRLAENFERPYFSKSIAEYWRRWHSTLGRWFKTYIYYPVAMAKWNQKLGRTAKDRFGKEFGRALPASIALVVVWLTTGLWHGATWAYIAWGGVNGLFIIFSLWMEPVYAGWIRKLKINEKSTAWRAFQVIRTYILVTFIKVLPEVGTLSQGFGLWNRIFTNHEIPATLRAWIPQAHKSYLQLAVCCGGILLILITDLIQRKQPIRQWLENHTNPAARMALFAVMFFVTIYIGYPLISKAGGFMYAEF